MSGGGIVEMIIFWTFIIILAALFLKDADKANTLTGGLTYAYTQGVGALGALG
jgi:hypothetical protein